MRPSERARERDVGDDQDLDYMKAMREEEYAEGNHEGR